MSRILLVGKGAPDRGGIPSFLDSLRYGELAAEHQLTFLNVAHSDTPQGGRTTLANVTRTLRDTLSVWRASRGHDIVHVHSALAPAVTVLRAGLLVAAGRLRGCRGIVHAHGGNVEFWLKHRLNRALMRLAMAPADKVVAVWTIGEAALRRTLTDDRVCLVDNGVPLGSSAEARTAGDPPRVLYVGLLTARKGVVDLLEASRQLRARGVDHELLLLGGTPDEGPEAELPVRAAADEHTRFLGTRPPEQMGQAYASADIFCLPSWWEAMPLSILEAMASGLPVVGTDVGDVSRSIQDGETGFVVPVQSPVDLASALEKLLTDPDLRAGMGAAGRARVEHHFSSATTAQQVSALYAEVLHPERPAGQPA
jgi:glycosyltransferase involved in cell wall biosynthesis